MPFFILTSPSRVYPRRKYIYIYIGVIQREVARSRARAREKERDNSFGGGARTMRERSTTRSTGPAPLVVYVVDAREKEARWDAVLWRPSDANIGDFSRDAIARAVRGPPSRGLARFLTPRGGGKGRLFPRAEGWGDATPETSYPFRTRVLRRATSKSVCVCVHVCVCVCSTLTLNRPHYLRAQRGG